MDAEIETTDIELSKIITGKYPNIKTQNSWYIMSGVSIHENECEVGKNKFSEIHKTGELSIGLNFFKMRFVHEIIPAYQLNDIIYIYDKDFPSLNKIAKSIINDL